MIPRENGDWNKPDDAHDRNHDEHKASDADDEAIHFSLQGCQLGLRLIGHVSNPTKHGIVTNGHDNARAGAHNAMRSLQSDVVCLEVVDVRVVYRSRYRLGFASKNRPIKLDISRYFDQAHVSR